ncbi:MAG: hypothetical protein ACREB5_06800 [Sphingomonadaceae bacterium]
MRLTATLCREQAAHQRALAANAVLDNVREVALKAALAWDREASDAEKRESRSDKLSCDDAAIAAEFRLEEEVEAEAEAEELRRAAGQDWKP